MAKQKGCSPSQIALAWLLKHSKVILPIPGTSLVKHLEENIGAATLELTDQEFISQYEHFLPV
jgi:aryl-alcohol dehydrogenase-like predicted oxidoreductase